MKVPFGFFANVTKELGLCEISSCLENYNLRKYLYQSNTLRTFRSLRNFVSFNDYNDEEKLLNNATSKKFRFTPYRKFLSGNLLFSYPVPLNSVFF